MCPIFKFLIFPIVVFSVVKTSSSGSDAKSSLRFESRKLASAKGRVLSLQEGQFQQKWLRDWSLSYSLDLTLPRFMWHQQRQISHSIVRWVLVTALLQVGHLGLLFNTAETTVLHHTEPCSALLPLLEGPGLGLMSPLGTNWVRMKRNLPWHRWYMPRGENVARRGPKEFLCQFMVHSKVLKCNSLASLRVLTSKKSYESEIEPEKHIKF